MKAGHCFTIEPMISEGTWRDEQWLDNWTAVTQDGKLSAQFEHTLLVTDSGVDVLTKRLKYDGLPYYMTELELRGINGGLLQKTRHRLANLIWWRVDEISNTEAEEKEEEEEEDWVPLGRRRRQEEKEVTKAMVLAAWLHSVIASASVKLIASLMPCLFLLAAPVTNVCAKCNLSFRMTSDLVYHMRSQHRRESDPVRQKRQEKLRCPVCGENFRERHHLTRHMTSHDDRELEVINDRLLAIRHGGNDETEAEEEEQMNK
uniref:EOG090X0POW n=1 Tax=Evadne anonyx TaxID=141404 RepID=A0A9N6WQU8_9CRUS|nr:EOG090X0POW [Evadne anonyx]